MQIGRLADSDCSFGEERRRAFAEILSSSAHWTEAAIPHDHHDELPAGNLWAAGVTAFDDVAAIKNVIRQVCISSSHRGGLSRCF